MATAETPAIIQIKKYPNRRFYDVTHSRHVTLQDLHHLVREGRVIHVTDSKSGDDITPLVLTQIILEHDPPKISLFSADLLHHVIQSNQQMMRMFIDNYFSRALDSFMRSQTQFEDWLRGAGIPGLSQMAGANPFQWARSWIPGGRGPGGPAAPPAEAPGMPRNGSTREPLAADPEAAALRQTVDELRRQVAELSSRRDSRRPPRKSGGGKKRKS